MGGGRLLEPGTLLSTLENTVAPAISLAPSFFFFFFLRVAPYGFGPFLSFGTFAGRLQICSSCHIRFVLLYIMLVCMSSLTYLCKFVCIFVYRLGYSSIHIIIFFFFQDQ